MDITRPRGSTNPIPENAKKVFSGTIFEVYEWDQEMFDGTVKPFQRLKRPDTVSLFPVLPDGRIIIVEETQPDSGTYIGNPGGRVDQGEGILEAAKRELLEETGYDAEEFILLNAVQPVNKIEWAVYTFIAKV
jgi:ADP-ribose pyrophosphatase